MMGINELKTALLGVFEGDVMNKMNGTENQNEADAGQSEFSAGCLTEER